jgi:eukaryotic-like serine/threonine-protein kinase
MSADPAQPFLPRYQLLGVIGRGYGHVLYRARDVPLERVVALEVLDQNASPDAGRRLLRKARIMAALDHPNIVRAHAVGKIEGRLFLSMELIEGGELTRHLPRFVQDQCAAAWLLAKVARAVHYVHQRGVLHRDLKPGHVLLDPDGEPHLIGFGLARLLDSGMTAPPGTVAGTALYMAPEQATATQPLTPAVDVYALGAILYELFTGRPPFRGQSVVDTLHQLLEREPEPPRALNPEVEPDLEAVCLKCLHKQPGQRYASAEALANDLERWLKGEAI